MSAVGSQPWRYLTADAVGAAPGLAFDVAMMRDYGRAGAADTAASLRLYTYRAHCALVGRFQHLESEVDLDRCAELGVEVGRRPTGGGAIIMGPAQLGVAIATRASVEEGPRRALRRYARGVIAGLRELGVAARFRSKNDLEVGGRKIAGLGIYLDSAGALLFHSSVLVDLDVALMLRVLKIPAAKLADKAATTVEQRLTTVSRELGRRHEAAAVRQAMARGLARELDAELLEGRLSAAEVRRHQELTRRYASPEWIHQRSRRRDALGSSVLKTPAGLLRVQVGIHGGVLKEVLLTGDFNTLPAGVARLESALKWCRAERSAIRDAVRTSLHEAELGVSPGQVATAVWRAVSRGVRLAGLAHPARVGGSCYFPQSSTVTMTPPADSPQESNSHDAADR